MIVVADAGSSKIDWAFIQGTQIQQFQCAGTNPSVLPDVQSILKVWKEVSIHFPKQIQEIHFFGAGCRNKATNNKIKEALLQTFEIRDKLEIDSDIIGAAKGLYGNDKGNILILGTGLNTGYYDGKKISFKTPSLGYLLGDEGSGTDLGKILLAKYLHNQLTPDLSELLSQYFVTQNIQDPISYIYSHAAPNKAIAGILTAFKDHLNNISLKQIVQERFEQMIQNNCLDYRNFTTEFRAVGSIAYYFQNELKASLEKYNFQLTLVAKSPIEGLIKFYS